MHGHVESNGTRASTIP